MRRSGTPLVQAKGGTRLARLHLLDGEELGHVGGHHRVLVELLVLHVARVAEPGVAAVGDVDAAAPVAEDHRVVLLFVRRRAGAGASGPGPRAGSRAPKSSQRVGIRSMVWVSAERRRARLVGEGRVVDEERDVADLLVERHPVLGPPVVLAEQEAVVGGEDEGGVLPQVVCVEVVEDAAEDLVAVGEEREVVGAELVDLGLRLGDALVARPVEDRAVVVGGELRLVAVGREEGLVRVEGLDLEQPVVGGAVGVEEAEGGVEALDGGEVRFLGDGSRLIM